MTWRLDCGKYRMFVIEDGYYWRDPASYFEKATEHDWRFHPRNDSGEVRMNFGCYLITDGERTVMVDSGIGEANFGNPNMITGLMPGAVDALGIARDSVETVVYTHMHFDHIGGSRVGGEPVFSHARQVFHKKEWDHWSKLSDEFGVAAQNIVRPFLDEGVVDFVDSNTEILPGVTAVESFGHTPGHLTIAIESKGTSLVLGGDMSNHPFQVEHPNWSLPVDNDHDLAAKSRDAIFESIRDSDTTFVAGHYPMPGVGHIVTENGVRVYRPGSATRVSQLATEEP
jgi:glyoxylase-like metal-dependent hydrolase (beta-lactamase superfamily II)